jgi:hypothetical protein
VVDRCELHYDEPVSRSQGGVMHVAALVLGILGLIISWIPFVGWLGVLFALVAVTLGIVMLIKKEEGKKVFGIIGLVLGGIALIIGLVIQIPSLLVAGEVSDMVEEQQESGSFKPDQPFE